MKTSVVALTVMLVGAANAQTYGASAELNRLDAWCPLDHKLTGLNLGYCNEDKPDAEEAGHLLEASERHATKLLFGGKGPGEKCGLCSFLNQENGCGVTKSKVSLTFDLAIKQDTFASTRRWCLLGKANMEVCRNFGSNGAGKSARAQMCKDLKAKKFKLDGLRALEFTSGNGESIADIVNALGQEKTYSFLGLGGCLQLFENSVVLRHVCKKVRADACAVICVRALDNPSRNVMDVATEVYKGFVTAGEKILVHHKAEYNKTNITQVLKNEKNLLNALKIRQQIYKSNLTTLSQKEKVLAKNLSALHSYEEHYRKQWDHYLQKAGEYRKLRLQFMQSKTNANKPNQQALGAKPPRVKFPQIADKDLHRLVYDVNDEKKASSANNTITMHANTKRKPKQLNETEIALKALEEKMNRKFEDEKKKLTTRLRKEKEDAVLNEALRLSEHEAAYVNEIEKVRTWTPEEKKTLLKSQ